VAQKATEGFAARDVYKCTPQLDAQQAKALISRWISDGYVRTSQRVYRGKPIVTHHVTDKGWKLLNDTK
jgi:S-adenosylmethionine/arginine decarboxylase-like enzyme